VTDRRWVLLPILGMLMGCPPEEPGPPPTPDSNGRYNLVFTMQDTACVPPDFLFDDLFAFLDQPTAGITVTSAQFVQEDEQLAITLESSGCVLTGSIGSGGATTVSGACDDALMTRQMTIIGNVTESVSALEFEGTLRFDVDGGPAGIDGTIDCSVDPVEVSGTGTPPSA